GTVARITGLPDLEHATVDQAGQALAGLVAGSGGVDDEIVGAAVDADWGPDIAARGKHPVADDVAAAAAAVGVVGGLKSDDNVAVGQRGEPALSLSPRRRGVELNLGAQRAPVGVERAAKDVTGVIVDDEEGAVRFLGEIIGAVGAHRAELVLPSNGV